MHTSTFFRLFPPPKFLLMKHAGLDISDDAIFCLEYGKLSAASGWKYTIGRFDSVSVPEGLMEGGDIKDENKFVEILSDFVKKSGLSYVKVSVPEEKAYLFQVNVTGDSVNEIRQNIEFKLEENVPLSVPDAVFYYDLLPLEVTNGVLRASVSVVPRSYIEHYMDLLHRAKLSPIAFEIVPKAIARAVIPPHSKETVLIINILNRKTGIYVVSGGVVSFTSTMSWGIHTPIEENHPSYNNLLIKEIDRIFSYWESREGNTSSISKIVLVGHDAESYEKTLAGSIEVNVPIVVANTWQNTIDLDHYVPPISKPDSLEYVISAGLAMDY